MSRVFKTSRTRASTSLPNTKFSCFKVTKVILTALPSVVFGVFTIVFTLQQNHVMNENIKQEQQRTNEQNVRTTFETYVNDISTLLLNLKFNRSNVEHLLHIQVKTMTVLRHVDTNRRRDIILFLYESRLIRSDTRAEQRLSLTGANLEGVQFIGSPSFPIQLDHLYLAGIYAPKITFRWCRLEHAVLDNASLSYMELINSSISYASFRQVYTVHPTFGDIIFHQNNFTGATIQKGNYVNRIGWKDGIDLTNADLLGSYFADPSIINFNTVGYFTTIILNARSANGTFLLVDISERIVDGGAENECSSNSSEKVWLPEITSHRIYIHRRRENSSIFNTLGFGNCCFLANTTGQSSLVQLIDVHLFSVLIDSGEAGYNISTYGHCDGPLSNSVSIRIAFMQENQLLLKYVDVFREVMTIEKHNFRIGTIDKETRLIRFEINAYVNETSTYCVIDDIHLNIFYNRK